MKRAAAALLLLLVTGPVPAQEPSPAANAASPDAPKKTVVRKEILPDGAIEFHYSDGTRERRNLPDPMLPTPLEGMDAATREKYQEAVRAYYSYRTQGLLHRQATFKWQLLSSRVIFVVVLTLVFAGIYFAAIQFHAGLREEAVEARVTEFSASATGIKVSSPILGVIILVISLAFFYLYLVYVYPISEIF
jgi:hypothetical protein